MTIDAADIDPSDGRAHIVLPLPRVANPGHEPHEQPFLLRRNSQYHQGFCPLSRLQCSALGITWKNIDEVFYTDWQLIDISPGNIALSLGDEVEIEVIAAGCRSVDNGCTLTSTARLVGAGPVRTATGPSGQTLDNVSPTLTYSNGGTGAGNKVVVDFNTTRYDRVGLTRARAHLHPAGPGRGRPCHCTIGTLAPGSSGSLEVTININPAATGTITLDNYSISRPRSLRCSAPASTPA